MNYKRFAFIMALSLSMPLVGNAEDTMAQNQAVRARMGEIKVDSNFRQIVDKASDVYSSLTTGKNGRVPDSVLKNSSCIAIIPEVVTGALIVGGTHGRGLATCKNSDNTWSQPAPITLNQGSIGVQAGVKSADLVLFFQNETAVAALKRGDFVLGSDVSAVAGTFDTNIDTSTAGVIVYTRSAGLFAGASVNGSKIRKSSDDLRTYYGDKTDYLAILEGRENPDTTDYAKNLTNLLP